VYVDAGEKVVLGGKGRQKEQFRNPGRKEGASAKHTAWKFPLRGDVGKKREVRPNGIKAIVGRNEAEGGDH